MVRLFLPVFGGRWNEGIDEDGGGGEDGVDSGGADGVDSGGDAFEVVEVSVDVDARAGEGLHMSMTLVTALTIIDAKLALEDASKGSARPSELSPSERSRGKPALSEYFALSASIPARRIERPRSKPVHTVTNPSNGSGGKRYGEKTRRLRVYAERCTNNQQSEHVRRADITYHTVHLEGTRRVYMEEDMSIQVQIR